MESVTGTVFNIQRYSIDDGPGVRTTVFMKGCPLTCLWCSNPESQNGAPELIWRYTSCKRCGTCAKICPEDAVRMVGDSIVIDRQRCVNCGKCVDACIPEALSITGKRMTVEEVFKVCERDRDYYEASSGGVTASGGEIISQANFVAELFKRCKEAGFGTCADTSGFGGVESFDKILQYSDIVLFDLKHVDPVEHRKKCGQDNEIILKNLDRAIASEAEVIIRVPMIPEFNESESAIKGLAELITERAAGVEVNIMPYHRYGENKYRMLGKEYILNGLREVSVKEKDRAKAIFEEYGIKCKISS